MTIGVLACVWRLPRPVGGEAAVCAGAGRRGGGPPRWRAAEVLSGRAARWLLQAAALLTGLLLAVLTVHLAGPWGAVAMGR